MIYLNKDKSQPLYEQIFQEIRREILDETRATNSALKPIRVLAQELRVSNNTVNRAYQELQSEGYIRSVKGSGYYVESMSALSSSNNRIALATEKKVQRSKPLKYDFNYEGIERSAIPWTKWRQYLHQALMDEAYYSFVSYETNKGNYQLRESICHYINELRGVDCTPEQIVICPGTQYAMDMLTNILPQKKFRVGFEHPGYNAMWKILENKGAKITPIPLSKNGIDLQKLESSDCNIFYVSPSHQFPTGTTVSMNDRLRIVEWSKRRESYVIENDYDNEFNFGNNPIPSIQALAKGRNVIYLSTLSKVLSPSVRCAYMVLPVTLMRCYEEKYRYFYASLPSYHQRALAQFIADGHLERHARRVSRISQRKCQMVIRELSSLLGNKIRVFQPSGGSHLLVEIVGCQNQDQLIREMKVRGVGIYGTKSYWFNAAKPPEDIFLLGYNAMDERILPQACHAFAQAVEEIYSSGAGILAR